MTTGMVGNDHAFFFPQSESATFHRRETHPRPHPWRRPQRPRPAQEQFKRSQRCPKSYWFHNRRTSATLALAPGLKQRHVTMLSTLVTGAGSSVPAMLIAAAGPAALLAYLIAGTWWCWSCACSAKWRSPPRYRFLLHLRRSLHRLLGRFHHRLALLVVLGAGDPLEGGSPPRAIPQRLVPGHRHRIFAPADLPAHRHQPFSVARYGEFEFWSALLKVIAIAFIVLGAVLSSAACRNARSAACPA